MLDRIKAWYSSRYKDVEFVVTSFLSREGDDELE